MLRKCLAIFIQIFLLEIKRVRVFLVNLGQVLDFIGLINLFPDDVIVVLGIELDQVLFGPDKDFLFDGLHHGNTTFDDEETLIANSSVTENGASTLKRLKDHRFVALMRGHSVGLLAEFAQKLVLTEEKVEALGVKRDFLVLVAFKVGNYFLYRSKSQAKLGKKKSQIVLILLTSGSTWFFCSIFS